MKPYFELYVRTAPEHRLGTGRDLERELTVHDTHAVGVADIPLLLVELLVIELVGPDQLQTGFRPRAQGGDAKEERQET